jgi:hypothetical protein
VSQSYRTTGDAEAPSGFEPLKESSGAKDINASTTKESNPRSQQSASDSGEDPDLANADAAETASEVSHKPGSPESVPTVDPGQLTVFDFLDESGDGRVG